MVFREIYKPGNRIYCTTDGNPTTNGKTLVGVYRYYEFDKLKVMCLYNGVDENPIYMQHGTTKMGSMVPTKQQQMMLDRIFGDGEISDHQVHFELYMMSTMGVFTEEYAFNIMKLNGYICQDKKHMPKYKEAILAILKFENLQKQYYQFEEEEKT